MKKMSKVFFIAVALLGLTAVVNAQPRAIGGRLGYGLDVSYQHALGEKNMVQLEVGFPAFLGLSAAATYDWIFPIKSWKEAGSWNWYAGVGGGGGYFFPISVWGLAKVHSGFIGVAGRIGIEYNFSFPLQLSLDWRPIIGPAFSSSGGSVTTGYAFGGLYAGAIAWGIRYRF